MASRASNNLASAAHLQSRPHLALTLYRQALLEYQRLGDRRGAAETYHNLGLVFRLLGELSEAESASGQAMRHAELVGERSLMALAVTGHAEISVERGELALAEQELERAARLAAEASDEVGAAEVARVRALAALRRGDSEIARTEVSAAAVVAARFGIPLMQAECAVVAAQAARRLGLAEEAERQRAAAAAAFSRLGATGFLERFEQEWADL
jgi:ATP/maltotriose-dependent transcriptional regulator MalT